MEKSKHCTVLNCSVLYCAQMLLSVLYCTVLNCTVLDSTEMLLPVLYRGQEEEPMEKSKHWGDLEEEEEEEEEEDEEEEEEEEEGLGEQELDAGVASVDSLST